jgi:large subunit ribosomal protein L25
VEEFCIDIQKRPELGKRACKRYRREGLLPVVVYHKGEKTVAALVERRQFVHIAEKVPASQVFTFKSEDSELSGRLGLVKEVQKDFLKNTVLHVDFHTIREGEAVQVRVPINLVGEAPGVKLEGGVLTVEMREVLIEALPSLIPHEIIVDVSDLKLNHSIHVSDLKLPQGVELFNEPDEAVVSVVESRTSKSMELETAEAMVEGGETEEAATEKSTETKEKDSDKK